MGGSRDVCLEAQVDEVRGLNFRELGKWDSEGVEPVEEEMKVPAC